jgi:hypothetical protein
LAFKTWFSFTLAFCLIISLGFFAMSTADQSFTNVTSHAEYVIGDSDTVSDSAVLPNNSKANTFKHLRQAPMWYLSAYKADFLRHYLSHVPTTVETKSVILKAAWYYKPFAAKHRILAWKDSNVLYKQLDINPPSL